VQIALVITELDSGGAEQSFVELATRLDRARYTPRVMSLAPYRRRGELTPLAERLLAAGIDVQTCDAQHWLETPSVLRQLSRWLRSQSPGVLQTFLLHANVLGALAARRASVPVVVGGIRVAERRGSARNLVTRLGSRWTDQFVCVSQSVANFAAEHEKIPRDKLTVIHNGVDWQRFAHAQPIDRDHLFVSNSGPVVAWIGRLDPQKDPLWLIERIPALLRHAPGAQFLLVGQGPLEGACHQRIRELNLAAHCRLLGFRRDIPELLRAVDLVVSTSRWEGLPNVLLESMAAGRPVVASDVEGVRELLGELSSAQIYPAQDADPFVSRAARFLTDPAHAAHYAAANQKRAAQFDWQHMVEQYQALYDRLVKTNPKNRNSPRKIA
jgi:glycosyltransferase involved in cell wall biosynthesis